MREKLYILAFALAFLALVGFSVTYEVLKFLAFWKVAFA